MLSLAPMLSVVIPTLNAAAALPATLAALADADEVVIADGGSDDGTRAIARAAGAVVIDAPRGRGTQLAAGARAARGDWLLFLHADTVLAPDWRAKLPADRDRAGYFRFMLDDHARAARRLERIVAWRCRLLRLPYGDQGLAISRALYDHVGGYRGIPLMEDVDLVRRLRRRLIAIDHPAITSAARYRSGYLRRSARNLFCLALWFIGVAPARIARIYGHPAREARPSQ